MPITNYNYLPPTSYATRGKDEVISSGGNGHVALGEVTVENLSGGANDVGIGAKLTNAMWKAGQWDASETGTEYVDDTTDAQDAGASDFALFTANVANDGFVVQCVEKFNVIGMTVGTAEAGSPVYAATYWNGSAWSALTTKAIPAAFTAADHWIAFLAPHDWAKGAGSGTDAGKYAVKIAATTAPTTAPLATLLWVGQWFAFKDALANITKFSVDIEGTEIILPAASGLMPYFGTAHAENSIEAKYRIVGRTPG